MPVKIWQDKGQKLFWNLIWLLFLAYAQTKIFLSFCLTIEAQIAHATDGEFCDTILDFLNDLHAW